MVTPHRREFRQYAKETEPGMVPDYNEPDKDLVPADGGLLDFIMNKWLVKPSPTRVIEDITLELFVAIVLQYLLPSCSIYDLMSL